MQISTILDHVDAGSIALPEFQRGYVWNREQVRELMTSLYRGHPVGSLLVWETKTELADVKGDGAAPPGVIKLLLDGQQRITSIYGIVRGRPPRFFDGDTRAFTDLCFNVDTEVFEFYGPVKMQDDPRWIKVTELMQAGVAPYIKTMSEDPALKPRFAEYLMRLNTVETIKARELHVDEVTGEDKTVEVVVDIFNRVNSGGTKLSKGDLALARICARWPDARTEMQRRLAKWSAQGFHFKLEWLLRCVNTVLTGEALFSALADVGTPEFRDGLKRAEACVDVTLNMLSSRLGIDHDRVLGSRYSFPLIARYLADRGGHLHDHRERDLLLYWYVHSFLWGRYAGSTETTLNQDLALIAEPNGGLDRLIGQLQQVRGDLRLRATDFVGWSRGARFYPLLYMLTRVHHARDWGTGLELSQHLLGALSSLELHHIFPKRRLYAAGYTTPDVNALANFTFLTKETNLRVSDREPAEYIPEFIAAQPGAVESHWLPLDPDLWRIENYRAFLAARRQLLADAANELLDGLLNGGAPVSRTDLPVAPKRLLPSPVGSVGSADEEQLLLECSEWVEGHGLPPGELEFELTDPETGAPSAIVDLAWPDGIQEGYSAPVALILGEGREIQALLNSTGYRFFTDVSAFRRYVLREVLGEVSESEASG